MKLSYKLKEKNVVYPFYTLELVSEVVNENDHKTCSFISYLISTKECN